jgi:hypothetical protein
LSNRRQQSVYIAAGKDGRPTGFRHLRLVSGRGFVDKSLRQSLLSQCHLLIVSPAVLTSSTTVRLCHMTCERGRAAAARHLNVGAGQ